jgi:hypothetical protein
MIKMSKAKFAIDSIPDVVFQGYTNGDTWNGWACPYFEKAEAERVLRASEVNRYLWTYTENGFSVQNQDDPEGYESEVFEALKIATEDGSELTVYAIGAYSWIWEPMSEV